MKVKIIKSYNDFQLNYRVPADTELEVTEERAEQLIKAGVATPPTTVKSGKGGRKKES